MWLGLIAVFIFANSDYCRRIQIETADGIRCVLSCSHRRLVILTFFVAGVYLQ